MKSSKIYLERIKQFQDTLKGEGAEAYLVTNPIDLLYFTGMEMSLGHLLIRPKAARLFVDGRYFEAASKGVALEVGPLKIEAEKQYLKGCKSLWFDGDVTTYTSYKNLRKYGLKTVSKPEVVKSMRLIKDAHEIRKMRASAQLGFKAYQYIRKKLKKGVSERELATLLEIYCLKNGACSMSFEPIIAFGKNTALPHHRPGQAKLKENDVVLFDLGVVLDHYCSDMTRVDFVGKKNPQMLHIHEVNRTAQRAALKLCKPGVKLKALDEAARKVMRSVDLEQHYVHSLGHGIGLEVHEGPRISCDGADRNRVLKPGMCITIEPGIYLPGKGGVRYEDTIVITPLGYENLYPEV